MYWSYLLLILGYAADENNDQGLQIYQCIHRLDDTNPPNTEQPILFQPTVLPL